MRDLLLRKDQTRNADLVEQHQQRELKRIQGIITKSNANTQATNINMSLAAAKVQPKTAAHQVRAVPRQWCPLLRAIPREAKAVATAAAGKVTAKRANDRGRRGRQRPRQWT